MFTDMKKATLLSALLAAAALGICFGTLTASAAVYPTFTSSLHQGRIDYDSGTDENPVRALSWADVVPDTRLGAHADFTTDFSFHYRLDGVKSGGVDSASNYPDGTDPRETLKNLVVDLPPGLVGNPNAVPYDERCDEEVFLAGVGSDANPGCPESATVGELWMDNSLIFQNGDGSTGTLSIKEFGPKRRSDYYGIGSGFTRVSLLKTPSEVPARIGIFVRGPVNIGRVWTILEIAPTGADLHLQARTVMDIPREVTNFNYPDKDEDGQVIGYSELENIRVERMIVTFFGRLDNGRAFMTSPTHCAPWTSTAKVMPWFGVPGSGNPAIETNPSTIEPDCSNAGSLPFPVSGHSTLSTSERGVSPAVDFTIDMPGAQGDEQASTTPKKIVTTLPTQLPIDVAQLGRVCERDDFQADKCAASTRVGTVQVETPLISAGLSGDVYLVRKQPGTPGNLPDLGLRVRGAITFTQLGTNRYVGTDFNQIQTTFDEIPQVGFTKLKLHLFGGEGGLLRTAACPTDSSTPAATDVNWSMNSWSGASAGNNSGLRLANCFGIKPLKASKKCVRIGRRLKLTPKFQSLARVKKVELRIRNKRRAKVTKSPFRINVKLQKKFKLKKNRRHRAQLRATYDDGTVKTRTVKLRVCR
jgi:hypothetical protein